MIEFEDSLVNDSVNAGEWIRPPCVYPNGNACIGQRTRDPTVHQEKFHPVWMRVVLLVFRYSKARNNSKCLSLLSFRGWVQTPVSRGSRPYFQGDKESTLEDLPRMVDFARFRLFLRRNNLCDVAQSVRHTSLAPSVRGHVGPNSRVTGWFGEKRRVYHEKVDDFGWSQPLPLWL